MDDRLISADKLKDIISDTWVIDRIDEQPTVDAVPVVRCRDCQYRGSTAECLERDDDWFCADGKRREDAKTN
jgi:hypothetical protein